MAAEDWKSFPGALCQPINNSIGIFRDSTGRMYNNNTVTRSWICPIVRDVIGDEIEGAEITVIDRNVAAGDPNVSCTLYSRTANGDFTASETHASAGGSITPTTLGYAVDDPNLAGTNSGYYYFHCTIPGTYSGLRSGIASYRVVENSGEN
jgi:hypothetical protein